MGGSSRSRDRQRDSKKKKKKSKRSRDDREERDRDRTRDRDRDRDRGNKRDKRDRSERSRDDDRYSDERQQSKRGRLLPLSETRALTKTARRTNEDAARKHGFSYTVLGQGGEGVEAVQEDEVDEWGVKIKKKKKMSKAEREKAALARLKKGKRPKHKSMLDKGAQKTCHWTQKGLKDMTERDWRIFKEDFNISCRGNRVPNALRCWEEAGLPDKITATLKKVNYLEPTPIQRQAVPIGLAMRDVVGIAETGSGKTCAFLLPMLVYILKQPKITAALAGDGPYALIMAPTRELAKQIAGEAAKFAKEMSFTAVSIVGGVSYESQAMSLREGAEIIIATPGRLYDCIERRYLVLHQCNYVVMDEADRMIDMNFEPQINKVLDSMPSTNMRPENEEGLEAGDEKVYRSTIMFSATMPLAVEKLAKKYLRHAIYIAIGDRSGNAAERVTQHVEWITEASKRKRLLEIVREHDPPGIIFVNTQAGCNSLARTLEQEGHNVTVLHAGKGQDKREANLAAFKAGDKDILVATDVAARGIDVAGVQYVVNFDSPTGETAIEKYTHRIGRTGRAGLEGTAYCFLTSDDTDIMYDLRTMLDKTGHRIPPEMKKHDAAWAKPGEVVTRKKRSTVIFC